MKYLVVASWVLLFGGSLYAQGITDPVQLSGGYDRFDTGNWSNNFGTWRDNNPANGDTWLAANLGHVFNYGGVSWIGTYVGAAGDFNEWTYDFVAPNAITDQDWSIRFIVNRVDNVRPATSDFRLA